MLPNLKRKPDDEVPSDFRENLAEKVQRTVPLQQPPEEDGEKKPSAVDKTLNFIKKAVVTSGLHALRGDEPTFVDGKPVRPNQLIQDDESSRRNKDAGDISKLISPLNEIRDAIENLTGIVSSIRNMMIPQPASNQKSNDGQIIPLIPTGDARPNAPAGKRSGGVLGYVDRATTPFLPAVSGQTGRIDYDEVASSSGESPTSAYRQNEKESSPDDVNVILKEFSDTALKQLADLFSKAFENMKGKNDGGGFGIPAVAGLLGGARGLKKFRLPGRPKLKGPGKQKLLNGPENKIKKVELLDRNGKFVKALDSNAVRDVEQGAVKAASKSKGLLKFGGKALGGAAAIATPIVAGMEYLDRKKQGQSQKQAVIGTAASTGGALAGGIAGAEGGAAIGGGIGALFGGVGAIPGAAIGGVVGGVGGAVAGSGIGSWLADNFTGANKHVKQNIPSIQTKDIIALEKNKEKKMKEQMRNAPPPTVISAPSTTNMAVTHNQTTLASAGATKGSRGSLDLRKY